MSVNIWGNRSLNLRPSTKAERRELRKERKSARPSSPIRNPQEMPLPKLEALNLSQTLFLEALEDYDQVFALGPAGTGKTYVATVWAVRQILAGEAEKLIITRPMVASDASEEMGFLPGDITMKFTPWAIPILDAIEHVISKPKAAEWLRLGKIEFAPFQFMRGRTFRKGTIVLLDEAQNCTMKQFQLFLTRMGDCISVISGDPHQSDIGHASGLNYVAELAEKRVDDASVCRFYAKDIVRSAICRQWVEAFTAP